ncbi:DinB family protein [Chloroflexia bacterium SDU3-3]|nr:DinB family protein [Chloroflexia bacterium SDU3-3]
MDISQLKSSVEHAALLDYLNAQRHHALGILDGLDDRALRQPMLPSGWTCLGLIQHLTIDVERFWFGAVIAGDAHVIDQLTPGANAWQVGADVPSKAIFDAYQQAIERANIIISATPLDAAPAWWPNQLFGTWRLETVREVILHVMTETATHAGHLDSVRELIDGRYWLVLNP